jgi:hypothetical protein
LAAERSGESKARAKTRGPSRAPLVIGPASNDAAQLLESLREQHGWHHGTFAIVVRDWNVIWHLPGQSTALVCRDRQVRQVVAVEAELRAIDVEQSKEIIP